MKMMMKIDKVNFWKLFHGNINKDDFCTTKSDLSFQKNFITIVKIVLSFKLFIKCKTLLSRDT